MIFRWKRELLKDGFLNLQVGNLKCINHSSQMVEQMSKKLLSISHKYKKLSSFFPFGFPDSNGISYP